MTNTTEPNCFVGSDGTHLVCEEGVFVLVILARKNTLTHIYSCTYDTLVDRMKGGKELSFK